MPGLLLRFVPGGDTDAEAKRLPRNGFTLAVLLSLGFLAVLVTMLLSKRLAARNHTGIPGACRDLQVLCGFKTMGVLLVCWCFAKRFQAPPMAGRRKMKA